MGSLPIRDLLAALEGTAKLLVRWGLKADEWCLLDGPAIKLHDSHFDSRAWRDHLNVYVNEQALPWPTREFELTVPPLGSAELDEILELARGGTQIHLVPAWRYYTAGFERKPVGLPSGRSIEAATLRGLFLRGCCFRSRTRISAFNTSTSANASLNCRPRSTRWRTASTHSWGICATRFLPWTMKVSDQRG